MKPSFDNKPNPQNAISTKWLRRNGSLDKVSFDKVWNTDPPSSAFLISVYNNTDFYFLWTKVDQLPHKVTVVKNTLYLQLKYISGIG